MRVKTAGQIRFLIVQAAQWGVAHNWAFRYPPGDIRVEKDPLTQYAERRTSPTLEIDCSQFDTCCTYAGGAPDPNGLGYNGFGYTGNQLDHLPAIPLERARPGDLAVFGVYPGHHVVVIVGAGSDPMCVSQGGPGDPKVAPLSHFGVLGPLTVLRSVRVMNRKHKMAKWRVVGDKGTVISHVHGTRFGWMFRHRQLAKNQRETLAFHRVHLNEHAVRQPRPPS